MNWGTFSGPNTPKLGVFAWEMLGNLACLQNTDLGMLVDPCKTRTWQKTYIFSTFAFNSRCILQNASQQCVKHDCGQILGFPLGVARNIEPLDNMWLHMCQTQCYENEHCSKANPAV